MKVFKLNNGKVQVLVPVVTKEFTITEGEQELIKEIGHLHPVACIKLLRKHYNLSLVEGKCIVDAVRAS